MRINTEGTKKVLLDCLYCLAASCRFKTGIRFYTILLLLFFLGFFSGCLWSSGLSAGSCWSSSSSSFDCLSTSALALFSSCQGSDGNIFRTQPGSNVLVPLLHGSEDVTIRRTVSSAQA
ncbi:hypothetical protein FKM82_005533 [Ascaphus truei]